MFAPSTINRLSKQWETSHALLQNDGLHEEKEFEIQKANSFLNNTHTGIRPYLILMIISSDWTYREPTLISA